MDGSSRRSTPTCPWSRGSASSSWRKASRLCFPAKSARRLRSRPSSMARKRPGSWRWPVRPPPKAVRVGRCGFWKTPRSSSASCGSAPLKGGGTRHRRARQRQHDRARSEKNTLQPHRKEQWVIPPEANGAFVAAMEEVLDVYTRPHDPDMPLVCLDETSKQLVAETRTPVPMKPGQPERVDYEYERNGTANLFMLFAPLEGFRHVEVTDHRKAVDYAKILKDLSDILFPRAQARRLVERFEWNYTPKHGSWLNMAESELGVLSSQCLNRRIPDKQTLS